MKIKKISIIIPTYNEEKTIRTVIKRINRMNFKFEKEIIVVDDGSTDETLNVVRKYKKIKVIHMNKNCGKTEAIKNGLKFSTGNVILIQDADLEYNPKDIVALAKKMESSPEICVVYGSRILGKNKKVNLFFYVGGRLLTFMTNLIYGSNITDESTGYKMFSKKLLDSMLIESNRFGFCPEVTAKTLVIGNKIYEVPISYKPRKIKDGKKIKLKDFWEAIYILIKIKISALFNENVAMPNFGD